MALAEDAIAGLLGGLFYALLAAGFALTLAVARAVNLAHGESVVVGAYVAFLVQAGLGLPVLLSLPLAALAATALAAGTARTVAWARSADPLVVLVVTYGLSIVLQNLLAILLTPSYRLLTAPALQHGLPFGPARVSASRLVAAGLGLAAVAGIGALLHATRLGQAMRATSQDPTGAALAGIDVGRMRRLAFLLGGALAGFAGPLFGLLHYVQPFAGPPVTILALTVAVLAGIGRVRSLLLGGVLLGVGEALAVAAAGTEWRELILFSLLLLLLHTRGRGLLPGRLA
jgi:branched-chain amino acid transport system permease protein